LNKSPVSAAPDPYYLPRPTSSVEINTALELAEKKGLLAHNEIPLLWRRGPYILTGYRFFRRKADCWCSIFAIHNETANIWTHLFALAILATVVITHYLTPHTTFSLSVFGIHHDNISQAPQSMRIVVLFFLVSSLQALLSSVLFHTHACLADYGAVRRFLCFDYSGISTAVLGTVLSIQHAVFILDPGLCTAYLLVTASLGAMCITLPWTAVFDDPRSEPYRMCLFLLLGSTGLVPFAHVSILHGYHRAVELYMPVLRALIPNIIGAVAFGAKIPERWMPGKFDLIGSSHNIWHMAIALGIAAMYKAVHEMVGISMNKF
jgi:adiponectin receptor